MECFVIIVNGWKPLTIIIKHTILDVAAALRFAYQIYQFLSKDDKLKIKMKVITKLLYKSVSLNTIIFNTTRKVLKTNI